MIESLLHGVPPSAVYLLVGLLVGVESIGIPLPGETALITAAVLSAHPETGVDPRIVALAAFAGAVTGDTIGYGIGRRYGTSLLQRLITRFPRHLSRAQFKYAEYLFGRFGMGTVFVGRFIALLRMLAGPLAGAMKLAYPRFLAANAAGALVWVGGITMLVHHLGAAANRWVSGGAWVLFLVVLLTGLAASRLVKRSFDRRVEAFAQQPSLTR